MFSKIEIWNEIMQNLNAHTHTQTHITHTVFKLHTYEYD